MKNEYLYRLLFYKIIIDNLSPVAMYMRQRKIKINYLNFIG